MVVDMKVKDACFTLVDYNFLEFYSKLVKQLEQKLIDIFEHRKLHYRVQRFEHDEILRCKKLFIL